MLVDGEKYELVKSSCDKLGNALHTKFDASVDRFSLLYDKITGRDTVRKAGIDLLQVCSILLSLCRLNKIL